MSSNSLKYPTVQHSADVMTLSIDQVPVARPNGMQRPGKHSSAKRDGERHAQDVKITSIRGNQQLLDLSAEIRAGLSKPKHDGLRSFPSLLLWDERGLKHFEDLTYAPEYYLTNTEISLLERHKHEIAKNIKSGSILLELGSGSLRKTNILLKAIDAASKHVDYYALDLDRNELERTLKDLGPSNFQHVRCNGLLGTYEDGLAWLDSPANVHKPRVVLSLGSTIGSFTRAEAAHFWTKWSVVLEGPRDSPTEGDSVDEMRDAQVIIGLDACKDQERVWRAYNDIDGANERFILNVLDHTNSQLGYKAFDRRHWTVVGEWDAEQGRHTQHLVPCNDVEFEGTRLEKGEKIFVVHSHKYDAAQRSTLWDAARLKEDRSYMTEDGNYGLHILLPA
ncbi:Histidine-specific methyltransferase, SAM-dependent [Teratosphaeria destructans]|uniref:Histidine-specific methyltransferase, SAM-dependent n=1 Tax=Teratosphaeria destructans TaxID=418781 RepID=A0A9W7VZR3_9PEZI|nr:Histidine-specific methyltransferase, SAM-dependent [Teratosphaeria destructans]